MASCYFTSLKQTIFLVLIFCVSSIALAQSEVDSCALNYYVDAININDVSCPGANDGSATISVNGCECVFSGCIFSWEDGTNFHTISDVGPGTYSITVTSPEGCLVDTSVVIGEPEDFVAAVNTSHPSCPGAEDGMIEIVPSATAGPLDFVWSDQSENAINNGLSDGTYDVTVTNYSGCTYITSVTLETSTEPIVSVSSTPSCKGSNTGSATINLAGVSPTSFTWLDTGIETTVPSASNLGAGVYDVWVSYGIDCGVLATVTVEELTDIDLDVETVASCAGTANGWAVVTVEGGASPYSFLWNDPDNCTEAVVQNLIPGSYAVTVTDANLCEYVYDNIIIETAASNAWASASNTLVCPGDEVQLLASDGFAYNWTAIDGLSGTNMANPTAIVYETTTYEVFVQTPDGCEDVAYVTVETMPAPNPSISVFDTNICVGESVQLIAIEASGATFSWEPANELVNPSSNAPIASPSETTTYTLTATSYEGCSSTTTITIAVEDCTSIGIEDASENVMLTVYPNPATDELSVQLPSTSHANKNLRIINTVGQTVYEQSYASYTQQAQLDISRFNKGLYYVHVQVGTENYQQKLIVH